MTPGVQAASWSLRPYLPATLIDALTRHGASTVSFDDSHDEIKGTLSAANLRALFSDPDFAGAVSTERGFRLSSMARGITANPLD